MLNSRFLKIAVFAFVLVLALPLVAQAGPVPSAEFLGPPSELSCTGGSYAVPTQYNLEPTFDRVVGSLSVPGVGVVAAYDQTGDRTDLGSYNFVTGAFSVPSGTPITAKITTYADATMTSPAVYECLLIWQCGTGTLVHLSCTGAGTGLDMYPLPDYAVVGTFTQNTTLLFAPDANATTDTVMEVGKSLWVIGINEAGTFYKVLLSGQPAWVPVGTIGPTYDDTWNGTPLPTEVVS